MKDFQSFYGTQVWKACRAAYRKQARGLCELCLKEGRFTAGEIVHHKTPLTAETVNNPDIALNFDNLMLVCRDHHAQLHDAKERRFKIDELGHVIIL